MIKTLVRSSFRYGGLRELIFKKYIELPSIPAEGFMLLESDDNMENIIEFKNNDNGLSSYIQWNLTKGELYLYSSQHWKYPVRDDVVDDIIKSYEYFGWERIDTTNVQEMKDFMKSEYWKTKIK